MKTIPVVLALLGFAVSTALGIDKAELDGQVASLTEKFESMQSNPEKAVPADKLQKAQAVILLDRTKGGFIFAFEGGHGVALARDPKTHDWSPAAFVSASDASLGFQIGGTKSFVVILLMTSDAERFLTDPKFKFNGEATGTAGDSTAGVSTGTDQPLLMYDDRKGLFGGAAVGAAQVAPDNDANTAYYGQYVSPKEILYGGKVKPSPRVTTLIEKLVSFSKGAKK